MTEPEPQGEESAPHPERTEASDAADAAFDEPPVSEHYSGLSSRDPARASTRAFPSPASEDPLTNHSFQFSNAPQNSASRVTTTEEMDTPGWVDQSPDAPAATASPEAENSESYDPERDDAENDSAADDHSEDYSSENSSADSYNAEATSTDPYDAQGASGEDPAAGFADGEADNSAAYEADTTQYAADTAGPEGDEATPWREGSGGEAPSNEIYDDADFGYEVPAGLAAESAVPSEAFDATAAASLAGAELTDDPAFESDPVSYNVDTAASPPAPTPSFPAPASIFPSASAGQALNFHQTSSDFTSYDVDAAPGGLGMGLLGASGAATQRFDAGSLDSAPTPREAFQSFPRAPDLHRPKDSDSVLTRPTDEILTDLPARFLNSPDDTEADLPAPQPKVQTTRKNEKLPAQPLLPPSPAPPGAADKSATNPGRIRRDALDEIFRRWSNLKKNDPSPE